MQRLLSLFAAIFYIQAASAQSLPKREEPVFRPGEELVYRVRYGFITAGQATLKVEPTDIKFSSRPVYHLTANGRTAGSFDVFKRVRNRYDSYIDKEDLIPHLYTENIREGNYRRNDKARFYQDQKKIVSGKGTHKGASQTFDILSAYYFARNLDLSQVKIGEEFTMHYYLQNKVTTLTVKYLGKETIKTSQGDIRCLKFNPSIQPGRIFRKDSKLYLWVSDDMNRVPVKANVELLIGSATLELSSAKGLKSPLDYSR
jgi:hypothetical protein